MRNAIEINNLEIKRGGFELGPINLNVEEGEIFAILGRTGSGKTVLLETLAGFYQDQYDGDIKLFGEDAQEIPPHTRNMGFVYQDSGLFPHMTVEQNIAYGLKMHNVPAAEIEEKIAYITDLLSITKIRKQYPATISGGERQRTALARSLVLNPKILLLDEPFSALDPATRQKMYTEINSIHDNFGCTIVFVTHDFSEAQKLAGRIGIMLHGQLKTVVDADKLFENTYDEDVEMFLRG
ncbi:MAG: ATP-binding cassette domain-containing protein [Oscillospiraceae bacterium]|nr:ATP-binding cassette domain-containing protein [Oscillospiraceae bacterium]